MWTTIHSTWKIIDRPGMFGNSILDSAVKLVNIET